MKRIMASITGMLLLGCATTGKHTDNLAQERHLDTLVADQRFNIAVKWALPMMTNAMSQVLSSGLVPPGSSPGRIDLQGSNYYVAMQGDTVAGSLPYYGERQRGGAYGTSTGIDFNGLAKDLRIKKNTKRGSYDINFSITEQVEAYDVWLTLFPGGKASARITSTDRFSIGYEGELSKVDPKVFKEKD